MQVKICGNTSLKDARVAVEAGADMLGFIFYDPSPRAIPTQEAAEIVAALRKEFGEQAPTMVGVFVDESPKYVRTIMETVRLDLAQLHGSEPPVEVQMLAPDAFKAIRPRTRGDAEALAATYTRVLADVPDVPHFLVDTYHPWKMGGTGETIEWAIPQVLARRFRILLAGGLTPDNVATAIERVQPWGVDVASGVEQQPGVKDHQRVREFVQRAKATDLTTY
ncbi:MAG: phosphoribosylanthranilate isomerase [Chloroflexota bacterium]|nr:phosphoribosylanthranilate isomerase [Chloroflexota bacterium]